MKEYEVYIKRIEWGVLEVEAKNPEDAKEKAYDAMCAGETNWGESEETFWLPTEPEPK